MEGKTMNRKLLRLAIIGTVLFLASFGRALAQAPDATVKITGKSLAAGVGFSWGNGVLNYQGKEYPFSISGFSAGEIGFNVAELSGEVFNLKNPADFNGNYTSLGAGITIGGGASAATMRNQNGVVMHVVATSQGFTFKLGVDGMKVELAK
jgi:hypothetical protein